MNLIGVQKAGPGEQQAVMDLLTGKFWPEHRLGTRQLAMAPQKIATNISNEMASGVVYIADDGNELVGTIGLHPFAPWWTDETILADGWFFIAPEHRRTNAARLLLRMAEEHARDDGRIATIGVFNSHDSDRKEQFFERLGWKRIGGWYMLDPALPREPL